MGVGNDPRYTPSTTFDTFPFPDGIIPNRAPTSYAHDTHALQISDAAIRLNDLRDNWLNPSELVRHEPEIIEDFPDRVVPVDANAAAILKQRTLTTLYNERPAWLKTAQLKLDAAVADAYGWPADISEDDALAALFELNQQRATASIIQGDLVA